MNNLENRIERLGNQSKGPNIKTWVDLIRFRGENHRGQ